MTTGIPTKVGHTDGGRAYLYYGIGSDGLDLCPRQQRTDGSALIVPVGSQYADGTWRELRRDPDELTLIGREERSTYYGGGARVAMRA